MPVAVTITRKGRTGRATKIFGVITFSGSYPASGEPFDFASINPITSVRQPDSVNIVGKAGFVYQYDYTNKKIFVYSNTAGGANAPLGEHTAAAYAAGVSGDTVTYEATWLA